MTLTSDLATDVKQCRKCLRHLPLDGFYRDSHRSDGRYLYCRRCCSEIDAARRPKVPKVPLSTSYKAVHARLPMVISLACCRCGAVAQEWAYDHADPNELTAENGPYSLDPTHYLPMCRSCHRRYDMGYRKETGTARQRGRPRRTPGPCIVCGELFLNQSHHRKTCSAACESALRTKSQLERQERARATRELRKLAGLGDK